MTIGSIINVLETVAPPSLQESYDNVGLLIGTSADPCTGVLVTLDVTEAVVDEAVAKKANLIVAHHPLIFGGLKRISPNDHVGATVIRAIRDGIAVYAIHTNLDNVLEGVNGMMAEKLGLIHTKVLVPKLGIVGEGIGSGAIGEWEVTKSPEEALNLVKERFGLRVIRHTPFLQRPVKRVALCGGAGSFLISNALHAGADLYITADVKYHEFFGAEGRMILADIGHFESEQFTSDLLFGRLREKFPNFAVLKSTVETNPIKYFI
ncbi:MAG: Nif3-like dinuclear metal center hexameric protein [Sphingobacteriales bacterium]|nr:MAG: Nif3-like dinuclear metal center hexameric protein [Sphingobacteriales bacterium]